MIRFRTLCSVMLLIAITAIISIVVYNLYGYGTAVFVGHNYKYSEGVRWSATSGVPVPDDSRYAMQIADEAKSNVDDSIASRLIINTQGEINDPRGFVGVIDSNNDEHKINVRHFCFGLRVHEIGSLISRMERTWKSWGGDTDMSSCQISIDSSAGETVVNLFVSLKNGDVETYRYRVTESGADPIEWRVRRLRRR